MLIAHLNHLKQNRHLQLWVILWDGTTMRATAAILGRNISNSAKMMIKRWLRHVWSAIDFFCQCGDIVFVQKEQQWVKNTLNPFHLKKNYQYHLLRNQKRGKLWIHKRNGFRYHWEWEAEDSDTTYPNTHRTHTQKKSQAGLVFVCVWGIGCAGCSVKSD